MGRMLRIGMPAAIQGFFRNGAYVLFFKIVALSSLGTVAVAAKRASRGTARSSVGGVRGWSVMRRRLGSRCRLQASDFGLQARHRVTA